MIEVRPTFEPANLIKAFIKYHARSIIYVLLLFWTLRLEARSLKFVFHVQETLHNCYQSI